MRAIDNPIALSSLVLQEVLLRRNRGTAANGNDRNFRAVAEIEEQLLKLHRHEGADRTRSITTKVLTRSLRTLSSRTIVEVLTMGTSQTKGQNASGKLVQFGHIRVTCLDLRSQSRKRTLLRDRFHHLRAEDRSFLAVCGSANIITIAILQHGGELRLTSDFSGATSSENDLTVVEQFRRNRTRADIVGDLRAEVCTNRFLVDGTGDTVHGVNSITGDFEAANVDRLCIGSCSNSCRSGGSGHCIAPELGRSLS